MKKLAIKAQGLMPVFAAFAMSIFIYGKGCGFLLYQPKVPAKLREME